MSATLPVIMTHSGRSLCKPVVLVDVSLTDIDRCRHFNDTLSFLLHLCLATNKPNAFLCWVRS